jgi:multiple sugar transport system substrate-binding protein
LPDQKGLWRVAALPEKTFGASGGSFFMITSTSKNKEAAWKWLKFMSGDKTARERIMVRYGAFPSAKAAQSGAAINLPDPYFGNQKVFTVWAQTARRMPVIVPNKLDAFAQDVLFDQLDQVTNEGKEIDQALKDARAQIERRVKR